MATTVHQSKFSEKTTIAVLSKYKGANINLDTLHKRINKNLELLESKILADSSNEDMKTLLLETMEIYCRDKCVAKVKFWEYQEGGVKIEHEESIYMPVNVEDWTVSIVKGGEKVRVHLTKEGVVKARKELVDSDKFHSIVMY